MRTTLSTILIALGMTANVAHAVIIDVTTMEFYPPTQTSPSHVNNTVAGSIDFTLGTGSFNSGGTNFFSIPWTATVVAAWEAPGSYTFAGSVPAGGTSPAPGTTFSYSFTLGANQYAAGLYFDWSVNTNIPVLAVFERVGNTLSVVPVDSDGDGSPGTAMVTSPFPGQTAAFSGVIVPEVPVPAAAYLLGSGLLGVIGVARRKKAV